MLLLLGRRPPLLLRSGSWCLPPVRCGVDWRVAWDMALLLLLLRGTCTCGVTAPAAPRAVHGDLGRGRNPGVRSHACTAHAGTAWEVALLLLLLLWRHGVCKQALRGITAARKRVPASLRILNAWRENQKHPGKVTVAFSK